MVAARKRRVAFFIGFGIALSVVILLLYVGWIVLSWRTAGLLVLGMLLLSITITGVVLNTIFLVREIRRNEQHDAFINAVTHELKTPVTSIRLYLETLQKREVAPAKRDEFYKIMLDDADRLLGTIDQVLRTGRVGISSRPLSRSRITLDAMVADCLNRARAMHGLPEESLQYATQSRIHVVGDPEEVRAALSNLIDNAIKYSKPPVEVKVETVRVNGRFVEVRVRDRGIGIPKVELKQIFKRFYRVPGPFAARVKGTGLGLFIVGSVAKRHGGRVWAESEGPGHGSTFILQLPVAR